MALFDLIFAFAVGLLTGAIYFAALWYTVRWLAPVWLLISTVLRLAFLVAVLFWVMDNDAMKLLAALAGFLVVRYGATWPLRRGDERERKGHDNRATEAVDATDPR